MARGYQTCAAESRPGFSCRPAALYVSLTPTSRQEILSRPPLCISANLPCCHALRAFRGSKPNLGGGERVPDYETNPRPTERIVSFFVLLPQAEAQGEIGRGKCFDIPPGGGIGHASYRTNSGAWRSRSKKGEERYRKPRSGSGEVLSMLHSAGCLFHLHHWLRDS